MPTLTVSEAILFSARMRLSPELPDSEKIRRTQEIIDKLSLRHVANTVIGDPATGGISPELRKKTSIAVCTQTWARAHARALSLSLSLALAIFICIHIGVK